jgi:hypothetical protein
MLFTFWGQNPQKNFKSFENCPPGTNLTIKELKDMIGIILFHVYFQTTYVTKTFA